MASATAIRKGVEQFQGELEEKVRDQLPKVSARLLTQALQRQETVSLQDFSPQLFYRLLNMSKEELGAVQEVGEELAARIYKNRFAFTTAEDFADLIKTRQVTHTRVTRALCHILLGLSQDRLDACRALDYPVYLRLLGFKKSAGPLLAAIKRESRSPLLTKMADAPGKLSPERCQLLGQDVAAAHLYEGAKTLKTGRPLRHEYTRTPVILP